MQISRIFLGIFTIMLHLPLLAVAQDAQSKEDIEAARAEMLKRWGVGLIKPSTVEAKAHILSRPLAEHSDEELRELAEQANAAANFVGFILDDYQEYYRDNYRHVIVRNAVEPFHDAYVKLSNRLKSYRNQAYFNLGKKAAARGDEITAFFLFRDAYRLSSFEDETGDHKGMRYRAEIEMKKLLGIDHLGTFIYWD